MKAEELMIGDWVMWKNRQVQIASVSGVVYSFGQIDVVLAHCNDDHLLEKHDIKSVSPIPLTPEILEKNGFKKAESDTLSQTWAWAEKSEKIYGRWVQITFYNEPINGVSYLTKIETCSSKGDGVNHLHSCDIESVHELQHALKLCGIKKKIVI